MSLPCFRESSRCAIIASLRSSASPFSIAESYRSKPHTQSSLEQHWPGLGFAPPRLNRSRTNRINHPCKIQTVEPRVACNPLFELRHSMCTVRSSETVPKSSDSDRAIAEADPQGISARLSSRMMLMISRFRRWPFALIVDHIGTARFSAVPARPT